MDVIIWLLSVWGCALIFVIIGISAGKMKKPMNFWSGTTVDPATVKDIPGYNLANRRMWLLFSLPFWLLGVVYFWSPLVAGLGLTLAAILGVVWLLWYYSRIKHKYIIK